MESNVKYKLVHGGFSIKAKYKLVGKKWKMGGDIHQFITAFALTISLERGIKGGLTDNVPDLNQFDAIDYDSKQQEEFLDKLKHINGNKDLLHIWVNLLNSDPNLNKKIKMEKENKERISTAQMLQKFFKKLPKPYKTEIKNDNYKFKQSGLTIKDFICMAYIRGVYYELFVYNIFTMDLDKSEIVKEFVNNYITLDEEFINIITEIEKNSIDYTIEKKIDYTTYVKISVLYSCMINGSRIPDAPTSNHPSERHQPFQNVKGWNPQFSYTNMKNNIKSHVFKKMAKKPESIVTDSHDGILSVWHSMKNAILIDKQDKLLESYLEKDKSNNQYVLQLEKFLNKVYQIDKNNNDTSNIDTIEDENRSFTLVDLQNLDEKGKTGKVIVLDIITRYNAAIDDKSFAWLGHLLHTAQDSYSESHVRRRYYATNDVLVQFPIVEFLDFSEQSTMEHLNKDIASHVFKHSKIGILFNYVTRYKKVNFSKDNKINGSTFSIPNVKSFLPNVKSFLTKKKLIGLNENPNPKELIEHCVTINIEIINMYMMALFKKGEKGENESKKDPDPNPMPYESNPMPYESQKETSL